MPWATTSAPLSEVDPRRNSFDWLNYGICFPRFWKESHASTGFLRGTEPFVGVRKSLDPETARIPRYHLRQESHPSQASVPDSLNNSILGKTFSEFVTYWSYFRTSWQLAHLRAAQDGTSLFFSTRHL